mgnify:CR=1 FL=1
MDIKILNQLSIRQYLADNGIHPITDKGHYGMYHSPLRADHNASMKVEYNKNLWIDYGTGEGGTLIDLVMRLEKCTLPEAIRKLEQRATGIHSFSFHGNTPVPAKPESGIIIEQIQPLTNQALITYLKERKINIDTAKLHCKEVHYSVNDKAYFAVGFQNNADGYELRNRYFKGCTSKDITTSQIGSDACLVFEGFMDALSYLTMKGTSQFRQDTVILNSVANLAKAEKFITSHDKVYTFLDNDEAGRQTTARLKTVCKSLSDQSGFYARHKDLNDYLICRQPQQEKKQSKGLRW